MPVSESLRRLVAERANYRCEYCLLHEEDTLGIHEADHIRPIKHHGQTIIENLAFACLRCNRHKGANIAGYDSETDQLTPLFNPRIEQWKEHFKLEGGIIQALTPHGRVTVDILRFNDAERIDERLALIKVGRYSE